MINSVRVDAVNIFETLPRGGLSLCIVQIREGTFVIGATLEKALCCVYHVVLVARNCGEEDTVIHQV